MLRRCQRQEALLLWHLLCKPTQVHRRQMRMDTDACDTLHGGRCAWSLVPRYAHLQALDLLRLASPQFNSTIYSLTNSLVALESWSLNPPIVTLQFVCWRGTASCIVALLSPCKGLVINNVQNEAVEKMANAVGLLETWMNSTVGRIESVTNTFTLVTDEVDTLKTVLVRIFVCMPPELFFF